MPRLPRSAGIVTVMDHSLVPCGVLRASRSGWGLVLQIRVAPHRGFGAMTTIALEPPIVSGLHAEVEVLLHGRCLDVDQCHGTNDVREFFAEVIVHATGAINLVTHGTAYGSRKLSPPPFDIA